MKTSSRTGFSGSRELESLLSANKTLISKQQQQQQKQDHAYAGLVHMYKRFNVFKPWSFHVLYL